MLEIFKNDRCQIYDLNNNLLVDDIITSKKDRSSGNLLIGDLISFDGKHYINIAVKELVYKKIDNEEKNFKKIKFDINKFLNYKMDIWHKICFDKEVIDDTVVIYRENDINELDPEVKDLVNTINKLPFINTFSSCSGHGTERLFVGIETNSLGMLEVLARIIDIDFHNDFIISAEARYHQNGLGNGFCCNIESLEKGEKAYEQTKKLSKRLEEYIENDLENDYDCIIKTSNIKPKEIYQDLQFDKSELNRLKNIFNKTNHIFVDMEEKYDEYNKPIIEMIFYDKKVIEEFLEILWNDFREDFVLKTNNNIKYVNTNESNIGICLTLEFIMPLTEMNRKIKLLNEALLNKITDWK